MFKKHASSQKVTLIGAEDSLLAQPSFPLGNPLLFSWRFRSMTDDGKMHAFKLRKLYNNIETRQAIKPTPQEQHLFIYHGIMRGGGIKRFARVLPLLASDDKCGRVV